MDTFELVIVGGGLTAARAISTYREAGGAGRIALLGKEPALPYHRPPLSKRFLRGEAGPADALVEPEASYRDHDVELLLGTEVQELLPREQAVRTRRGERYGYRKLLVATGATPRSLTVAGSDLAGVFNFRSLADATAVRDAAAHARDAVVVGSGFIGMEVAASLTTLGLEVTLVSRDVDLFAQLRSPDISDHLVGLYRRHGVNVILGEEVRAFRGGSRLDTVELHHGDPIGAHLAVVGIGVQPELSFLAGSGITARDGVPVDATFATEIPGVYAAGDVARFHDPVFGRERRIEHWSNANYQGAEVGRILAGARGRYDTVSTFFTESFGLTLKVFGDLSQHDRRITRGSVADGDAIVFYLEGDRLAATLHTGQGAETEETLKSLIAAHAEPLGHTLLEDASVPLDEAFRVRDEPLATLTA